MTDATMTDTSFIDAAGGAGGAGAAAPGAVARSAPSAAAEGAAAAAAAEGPTFRVASPEEIEAYVRHARALRAQAMHDAVRALWRAIAGAPGRGAPGAQPIRPALDADAEPSKS